MTRRLFLAAAGVFVAGRWRSPVRPPVPRGVRVVRVYTRSIATG